MGFDPLPTGTLVEVSSLPQMDIIRLQEEMNRANHLIHTLEQKNDDLARRIDRIENDKIIEFKNNDVYEVNKRIERLEAKIALINSVLISNRITRFLFGW